MKQSKWILPLLISQLYELLSSHHLTPQTFEQWLKKQGDGIIFDYDLVKINATSSTVYEFVENAVGYKIELIEKD